MNRNPALIAWPAISCLALAMLIPTSLFAQGDYTTFKTNLDRLAGKLKSDPFNDALCLELAGLVSPRAIEKQPQTDDWLRRSVSDNSAVIHLLDGIRQIESGRLDRGSQYWQLGYRSSKHGSLWLNSMLMAIVTSDLREDFENESTLIDAAILVCPKQAKLRLTKGILLLSKDKQADAFEQFGLATELAPLDTDLRKKLIGIYKEQNQPNRVVVQQEALDKVIKDFQAAKMTEAQKLVEKFAVELAQKQGEKKEWPRPQSRVPAKARKIKQRELQSFTKEFKRLATEVIDDPENQKSLTALAKHTSNPRTDKGVLQMTLSKDEPAAISHIILGIRLLEREQKQESDKHFEVAALHCENSEAIIKNLFKIMSPNDLEDGPEKLP